MISYFNLTTIIISVCFISVLNETNAGCIGSKEGTEGKNPPHGAGTSQEESTKPNIGQCLAEDGGIEVGPIQTGHVPMISDLSSINYLQAEHERQLGNYRGEPGYTASEIQPEEDPILSLQKQKMLPLVESYSEYEKNLETYKNEPEPEYLIEHQKELADEGMAMLSKHLAEQEKAKKKLNKSKKNKGDKGPTHEGQSEGSDPKGKGKAYE